MNREIKFRGKSIMNNTYGDWLYSSGIKYGDDVELMYCDEDTSEEWNYIDKETVGQYTGLHDKNGKEIYEGDIAYCQTKYGKAKAIIKFIEGKFVAYWNSALTHPENGHHIACYEINKRFEVIGNEYDNPELAGGE